VFVAVTRDSRAGSDAIEVATPHNSKLPAPGRAAAPVASATTADPRGVAHVCTADPPCGMHEVSLDVVLAQRRPVMLMFATPRYCQTAVCGPSVTILDRMRISQDWGPMAFIHVEIYRDDGQTLTEPVERWGLPSEPRLFAIGADGIIRARADGPLLTLPDEVGRLGRAATG
jgi:hypothetical protein